MIGYYLEWLGLSMYWASKGHNGCTFESWFDDEIARCAFGYDFMELWSLA